MPSAFIPSGLGYPAMALASQPVHQRSVHPGPLVLRTAPLRYPILSEVNPLEDDEVDRAEVEVW